MTLLCKDCIHCKPASWFTGRYRFAKCAYTPDLVDGSASNYCSVERKFDCGPEAKYFEPKRKR